MLIKSNELQVYPEQQFEELLTPEALAFLQKLHQQFDERRQDLLTIRDQIQKRLDNGKKPDFPLETKDIREQDWTIAPLPNDLEDRRVEITGPVDRKMVINALNSGAKGFMADFEDATSPTWENVMNGQINLKDAIRREIDFQAENGKHYKLREETAVLMVRPRGWHMEESNLTVNGNALSASLVDFGLYFFTMQKNF